MASAISFLGIVFSITNLDLAELLPFASCSLTLPNHVVSSHRDSVAIIFSIRLATFTAIKLRAHHPRESGVATRDTADRLIIADASIVPFHLYKIVSKLSLLRN